MSVPPEDQDETIVDQEGISDGSDVMNEVIADFIERSKGLGPPEISTGIKALDRAIIGLRPGRTLVVAGRPGMGKTALTSSIRRSVVEQGYAAVDFNLEMAKQELLERELAFRAHMNLRKVMSAKDVTVEEMARVMGAKVCIPKGMWAVYDDCFSMVEIQRKAVNVAKRLKREGKKVGLVTVDYLQLIGDVGGSGNRQESVAHCSRTLKMLSKLLGCTVMVLSQLNRGCEYRDDKRPLMSDLRESGSIEQDADTILFVYRDFVYNPSANPEEAELIIRKQRSGPLGTVRCRFNARMVSFEDMPQPLPSVTGVVT